jgi:predicted nucleic acid-binding protein
MIRVALDTNIFLDVALRREPFLAAARTIWNVAAKSHLFTGCVSANALTDIFYVAERQLGKPQAIAFVTAIAEHFEIMSVDATVMRRALKAKMADFEDAVFLEAAAGHGCERLITRNLADFRGVALPVEDPSHFVKRLKQDAGLQSPE